MTMIDEPVGAVDAQAVEAYMGRLTTDLGGSLGVLLISLGTRSGLWRALDGAGPLTVGQVADRVTVDRALVREWLRAQAAAGYLEYEPATAASELSPRPPRRSRTAPAPRWSRRAWR